MLSLCLYTFICQTLNLPSIVSVIAFCQTDIKYRKYTMTVSFFYIKVSCTVKIIWGTFTLVDYSGDTQFQWFSTSTLVSNDKQNYQSLQMIHMYKINFKGLNNGACNAR